MIQDIEIQADIQEEYTTITAIASKYQITLDEYHKIRDYDMSLCIDFHPTYNLYGHITGYFNLELEAKKQAKHDARIQAMEAGLINWHDKY